MDYSRFSRLRGEARAAFDSVEDWMADVFGENREEFMAKLEAEDLDLDHGCSAPGALRRGVRFFAAGRVRDARLFASFLFPAFEGDPQERCYRDAAADILRVAGGSLQPGTRHKLSFEPGVLYFTADARGHVYGVVASGDYPMEQAFRMLEELVEVYEGIDVATALDGGDPSLWREAKFRDDAFGVRELAAGIWKRLARPGDGEP
eukprot:TRINITY_DN14837_c0_g1_i1.p2 TRINITY_DN14837_c0_g1~~TRINITY_DN14837_c0_g1_i1.p2  ORF type:complete len:205 (-),score=61.27 TRINITY_DN14837_c0_g1_i1:124-738(-)